MLAIFERVKASGLILSNILDRNLISLISLF